MVYTNQSELAIRDQSDHSICALTNYYWSVTNAYDWSILTNQKITLIIFWLVKKWQRQNPDIPLVEKIIRPPANQPGRIYIKGTLSPLTSLGTTCHHIVPPPRLWWVTHWVTKALRLIPLPRQQVLLSPSPPPPPHSTDMSKDGTTGEKLPTSSSSCSSLPQGIQTSRSHTVTKIRRPTNSLHQVAPATSQPRKRSRINTNGEAALAPDDELPWHPALYQ